MMKIIVSVFFGVVITFGSVRALGDVLSKDEFTSHYTKVVAERISGVKVKIKGQLEVEMETADGNKQTGYLDNAYKEYINSPSEIGEIVSSHMRAIIDVKNSESGVSKSQIFPVVKGRIYLQQVIEMIAKGGGEAELPFHSEKLNDELYVLYALDTPNSMRYLAVNDIEELGVKLSDLRDLAKSNLKKSIPDLRIKGDPSRVSMLSADGIYEASLILFDGLWTKEQFPVKGEIVIHIPSREAVLITGSEDKEGIETVRAIIAESQNETPYHVSNAAFIRKGGAWKLYK